MKPNFALRIAVGLLLALAVFSMPASAQQTFLGQTTLAATVPGQILGMGPSGSTAGTPNGTLIQVASATGMVGINPNLGITASQPNQTAIYVDREYMLVLAVNGNVLTVARGQRGTLAAPHASGSMVLFGAPRQFFDQDPGGAINSGTGISGVACLQANTIVSPWLNVRTGAQWLCSSQTNTWVAGWNNPTATDWTALTATVASATGTVTPSGPVFQMTGTGTISGFNVATTTMIGFPATVTGGGCFVAIPSSGIWTWTAAGDIATAGTVTAANNVPVTFCWNAATQKFIPSRIA